MELLFERSKTNHRNAIRNTITCLTKTLIATIVFGIILGIIDLPCIFFPSQATAITIIVTNIILGILWMICILKYLTNIISFNRKCDKFDEDCSNILKQWKLGKNVHSIENTFEKQTGKKMSYDS